ncbi:MAG TPA: 3-hydroxyacyl-CoA dehydrogenase family protein, partial [Candidatus Polarisedimenticolia bacterium]|nr:3-hydroxyacyl-CoA dehydrogenase family protein [Candidatus Polarisedimenticolia bacterium]
GPFALLDQIGLDVAAKVADVMQAAFPERPGRANLLHAMMQAGLLGVKSGKGFYLYPRPSTGSRPAAPRGPTPQLGPILAAMPGPPAGPQTALSGPEIAQRLSDAMINEAAYLLSEKAVERAEVIDLAMVFGTGFPPFRGGLLRYADAAGGRAVAERLAALGRTPAPILSAGGRFYP